MSITEKLAIVKENVERVFVAGSFIGEELGLRQGYENGFIAGTEEAKAQCDAKHYAAVVTGDGSTELCFHLPFEPDLLHITANDSDLRLRKDEVSSVELDFSALGQLAGKKYTANGSAYAGALALPSTVDNMFDRSGDGWTTIKDVANASGTMCKFSDGIGYMVVASKLDLEPLKTRIEKSVARLPSTKCTAYYQAAKVNAAFTTDEWEALTDTKPNCTFSLI